MQILLDNVLDVHTLDALTNVLADAALFEDGKKTAGSTAGQVKSNLQAFKNSVEIAGACKLVEQALLANPLFKAAAMPEKFAKIMFSCYRPGMQYGTHVDNPFMDGVRTDLSFTLFLSNPVSYSGGELVLCKHDGEEQIKLPQGSLLSHSLVHKAILI